MKKLLILFLVLLTALSVPAGLAEAPEAVPDFTVTTIDGETLTLFELLEEKDLVLLNIFTSWCPPCKSEFPMLEAVYEQYADRMAVIAVSDEPDDTVEILDDYRNDMGLTFDVARMEGTGIRDFVSIMGYPTSLFIAKGGNVGYFQLGAFLAYPQLTGVVEHMLSEGYDGSRVTFYGVFCEDEDQNPVEGATVAFCTDTFCEPVTSDENGMILYFAAPGEYHLQLLQAPEGYRLDGELDFTTDSDGGWLLIPFARAE